MAKFMKNISHIMKLHRHGILTRQGILPFNTVLECPSFVKASGTQVNKWPCSYVCLRHYAKGAGGRRPRASKSKAVLSDEEMMDVVDVHSYRSELQAILDKMKADYVEHLSIHTSAGSIDTLPIEIEGETYPLNELAQIARKPNLVAINLSGFPEGLKPAIQAINESGLGLNPQQEGTMIYLTLPKVTREFREKLSKNARTLFIKVKDDIRSTQNSFIKEAKSKTDLSEDLVFSAQQQLTSIAEDFAAEAEKIMKTKQKELLGET